MKLKQLFEQTRYKADWPKLLKAVNASAEQMMVSAFKKHKLDMADYVKDVLRTTDQFHIHNTEYDLTKAFEEPAENILGRHDTYEAFESSVKEVLMNILEWLLNKMNHPPGYTVDKDKIKKIAIDIKDGNIELADFMHKYDPKFDAIIKSVSPKLFAEIKEIEKKYKSGIREAAERKVHEFATTGLAYDYVQSSDTVKDGDILLIDHEKVVGIATTWPIAVTKAHGELHVVGNGHTIDEIAKEKGFTDSLKQARELAKSKGWDVR